MVYDHDVCLPTYYADIYEIHVHAVVNDNINMYLYDQTAVFHIYGCTVCTCEWGTRL